MKGKTLIVDDEPQMRSMMAEWLTHAGYESLTACDGEEGLISLLKEQPDVAVSDVCVRWAGTSSVVWPAKDQT